MHTAIIISYCRAIAFVGEIELFDQHVISATLQSGLPPHCSVDTSVLPTVLGLNPITSSSYQLSHLHNVEIKSQGAQHI